MQSYRATKAHLEQLRVDREALQKGVDTVAGMTVEQAEQLANLDQQIASYERTLPMLEGNGYDEYMDTMQARNDREKRLKEASEAATARAKLRAEAEAELDRLIGEAVVTVRVEQPALRKAFAQHLTAGLDRDDGSTFSHHTTEDGEPYTVTSEQNGVMTVNAGHEGA